MDSGRSDGRCAQVVNSLDKSVSQTVEHVKDCAPMVAEFGGSPSQTVEHLKGCAPRLEIPGEQRAVEKSDAQRNRRRSSPCLENSTIGCAAKLEISDELTCRLWKSSRSARPSVGDLPGCAPMVRKSEWLREGNAVQPRLRSA